MNMAVNTVTQSAGPPGAVWQGASPVISHGMNA